MFAGLPALSIFFLILEKLTHFEFLLHVAAIPLEILFGAFLVERYLSKKERKVKLQQLMHIKSYLFRSEMRNVFIANFDALVYPDISIANIKNSSLMEIRKMRNNIEKLKYRSLEEMELIILEYANAHNVFHFFMEWAIDNGFESIFQDMIYILHFIQDVRLYKKYNPDKLFIKEAGKKPQLMEKVNKVLKDGICKLLDYAIELKEKQPDVLDELLSDYLLSSRIK